MRARGIIAAILLLSARAQADPLAILVDGGGMPLGNRCDFYEDLDRGETALPGWDHAVFAADGANGTGPNSEACDRSGDTRYDADHRPILARRMPSDAQPDPATRDSIERLLKQKLASLKPGEPILLYFTDHGGNPDWTTDPPVEHRIGLWGEALSVTQLREMLEQIPESHKVILIHDHCFGGGMLNAIWERDGVTPRPHTCGFSPASEKEVAFDGESFMKSAARIAKSADPGVAQAVDGDGDGNFSFGEVFNYMKRSYATTSTPVSSSDLFLDRYLESHYSVSRIGSRQALLSQCLFAPGGTDRVAEAIDGSYKVVLHNRVERLRGELKNYYAGAGVSTHADYDDVMKILKSREDKVSQDEVKEQKTSDALTPAIRAWVREKMGAEKYDEFKAVSNRISDLKLWIELSADDSQKAAFKAERAQLSAKYLALGQEAYKWQGSADDNPAFSKFVASRGGPPPAPWPVDAEKAENAAAEEMNKDNKTLVPLRRLAESMKSANALGEMVSSNDTQAMRQYLGMLDCENTPMGKIGAR